MQFANPIWLWALSGILIPVGIHLFSRKEGTVIPMGSLRYLRESPAARYRNIRLNEIALLLLRCLMVALPVLLLAGAEISWSPEPGRKWLLIEPGIEIHDDLKPLIEKLENEGFQLRSLARDFPLLSDETIVAPTDNYWSAATQLVCGDVDSVVVISYHYQRNFRGERIAMPPCMKWFSYPAASTGSIAQTFSLGPDSVWIRKEHTSPFATHYETITASSRALPDSITVAEPETFKITIFTGEGFGYDEKVLRATLEAIQSVTPHKFEITTKETGQAGDSETGIIFWLADEPPSANGGNLAISYRPCHGENLPLLIASETAMPHCAAAQNGSWVITKRLSEEIALREHFAVRLARIMLPSSPNDNSDQRVLPEGMMWSQTKEPETGSMIRKETGKTGSFIIMLLALLLLAERVVAFKRDQ